MDSLTHAPIAGVSIRLNGSSRGVLTDSAGKFQIHGPQRGGKLIFSAVGYHAVTLAAQDSMLVFLGAAFTSMHEVIINSRKRYRNKNNPAVELIREVIAHEPENAPAQTPFISYKQYEKINLLTDRPPHILADSKLFSKYHFLFDHPDSSIIPGRGLIPAYLEEWSTLNYHKSHPTHNKQIILGHKRVKLGEYIDAGGISAILDRVYQDFNIYDHTMQVYTMPFLSPVAETAPVYYMYFIADTLVEDGIRQVHLIFQPRNPEDLLFRGDLYISLDGKYSIKRAELEVSKHININWVRSFHVTQKFMTGPEGHQYRSYARLLTLMTPLPKSRLGVVGIRTIDITAVSDTAFSDRVFKGLPIDTTLNSVPPPDSFWVSNRPIPLSETEVRTYANTDSLVKMKSYHQLMDWVTVITSGFKSAGKFDIGPVGSFLSSNQLEGTRLQLGGRTNAKLSKTLFGEGYLAYGQRDKDWKYNLIGTYSINHKSIYTYPFHYIQVSYMHDTRNPGQDNEFAQNNRFLYSFSRGIGGKWLYSDVASINYVREFGNHYSWNFGFKRWVQTPALDLNYVYDIPGAAPDTLKQITTTQLSATFGWAPHQRFYQGKETRRTITDKYPVFTFQYALGIKGLWGGQYNYDAFHLNITKRTYWGPYGYTHLTFDAGYITGNLPFPLLVIHPSNSAYYYSFNAYNLMNTAEFVSDHYASLMLEHHFNGYFFNKIPLVKKLRLREVLEAKILFGGVRPENNPLLNPDQMKFPPNNNGELTTFVLNNTPYLEAGFGIANILNFLRLDLVWRLTYLQNPEISTLGLRFSTSVDF